MCDNYLHMCKKTSLHVSNYKVTYKTTFNIYVITKIDKINDKIMLNKKIMNKLIVY